MTHRQIAGNKSINSAIYRCFQFIDVADVRVFLKKFREQPHDELQVMHTYRELIVGGFIGSTGRMVKYEKAIGGKTPDWTLVRDDATTECILEIFSFHVDRATEGEISKAMAASGTWCGFWKPQVDRLYQRIREKVVAYREATEEADAGLVVAIFGDFEANVERSEIEECLCHADAGLFLLYPHLSGVLFFEELNGRYHFSYLVNATATKIVDLPSGEF